jgi:hypothetical protein
MLNAQSRWPILAAWHASQNRRSPTSWNIYKVAKKAVWLGTVEAPDKRLLSKQARKNLRRTHGASTRRRGNDQAPSALLTPSTRRTVGSLIPWFPFRLSVRSTLTGPRPHDAGLSMLAVPGGQTPTNQSTP